MSLNLPREIYQYAGSGLGGGYGCLRAFFLVIERFVHLAYLLRLFLFREAVDSFHIEYFASLSLPSGYIVLLTLRYLREPAGNRVNHWVC